MAARAQPDLRAAGLRLRPWRASDRAAVMAAFADPAIQRWHCRSMTDDEARAWIAAWPDRWRAETGAGWAVLDADADGEGAVAGQISLRRVYLGYGLAEVSYWMVPAARGRGIARRALATLASWSFGTLGLHRIELNHSTRNLASCRVAGHAGFALEGTKRAEVRHTDGWHDMHLHARLDTDERAVSGTGRG
jgi:RimJ/RimL family protein N-acetyltransferase